MDTHLTRVVPCGNKNSWGLNYCLHLGLGRLKTKTARPARVAEFFALVACLFTNRLTKFGQITFGRTTKVWSFGKLTSY
jgi:hypothetical protein